MFETDRVDGGETSQQPWSPQLGTTVKLKSGGPPMTVVKLAKDTSEPPAAMCKWFRNGANLDPYSREISWGDPNSEWFPFESLESYPMEVK